MLFCKSESGQSIVEFVSGWKSLTGKCEFTNVLLNDIIRDRFICGLRAEQIKRKMIIGVGGVKWNAECEARSSEKKRLQVPPST